MSNDHHPAIDCGTQSLRAPRFDARGDRVGKAQVDIAGYLDHRFTGRLAVADATRASDLPGSSIIGAAPMRKPDARQGSRCDHSVRELRAAPSGSARRQEQKRSRGDLASRDA